MSSEVYGLTADAQVGDLVVDLCELAAGDIEKTGSEPLLDLRAS